MIDEVAKLGWELVANIKTWFGRDGGVLHLLLPRFFGFFFTISWGSPGVTLIVHYMAIHKFPRGTGEFLK